MTIRTKFRATLREIRMIPRVWTDPIGLAAELEQDPEVMEGYSRRWKGTRRERIAVSLVTFPGRIVFAFRTCIAERVFRMRIRRILFSAWWDTRPPLFGSRFKARLRELHSAAEAQLAAETAAKLDDTYRNPEEQIADVGDADPFRNLPLHK